MSPFVARVVNVFPQVQVTVASTYSGWISVFMVSLSVDARSTRDRARVVALGALVDLVERVGDGARRARAARPLQLDLAAGAGVQAGDRERLHRASDDELQRECLGRAPTGVGHRREVAPAEDLEGVQLEVGPVVGLPAVFGPCAMAGDHAPG